MKEARNALSVIVPRTPAAAKKIGLERHAVIVASAVDYHFNHSLRATAREVVRQDQRSDVLLLSAATDHRFKRETNPELGLTSFDIEDTSEWKEVAVLTQPPATIEIRDVAAFVNWFDANTLRQTLTSFASRERAPIETETSTETFSM